MFVPIVHRKFHKNTDAKNKSNMLVYVYGNTLF